MFSDKPLTIKIALVLAFIQLIAIFFVIVVFNGLKAIDTHTPSLALSLHDSIVNYFHLDLVKHDANYALGTMVTNLFFPTILTIVSIIGMFRKKYWLSLIPITFSFLWEMSFGFPVISSGIILLLLSNPSRKYLSAVVKIVE